MPRFTLVLLLLGLAAAACQTTADTDPNSTLATTSSVSPESEISNDRIVVSTVAGAVAVHDVDGGQIVRFDPPDGHTYRQPTWLDGTTIIFSEVSPSGDHSLTAADAETGSVVWRAPMETPPFFFAPSFAGEQRVTTSLRNDPTGAGLIAELIGDKGEVTVLSHESPFYTSWSPDGAALAIHIAGQHLDIRREGTTETILTNTGLFQTPVWTERGLITLRTVDGIQRLTSWSGGVFTDIAEVEGPVGFVAAGTAIAVQAIQRPDAGAIAAGIRVQSLPTLPSGNLIVIDQVTGTFETASSELGLLYQWDRDGEKLLFATLGEEPLSLVWNVWSDGTSSELVTFTLQPPWFQNLVPFFDQYAQSVQLWSSSGDHIGYPSVVDGQPVVVIQPVDGGEPVQIDDATWAAWAPLR